MVCAIHQPQYLPYFGFFDKLNNCDIFVFLDDCQFKKNEWQNRNKIRTKNGWQWLTVPVIHNFGQKLNEVKINSTVNWRNKHKQAIITNYSKSPYFKEYFTFFSNTYDKEWHLLIDINLYFINFLIEVFNIKTKTVLSSSLGINSTGTLRLIDICKKVGCDTYLSGPGGKEYLDIEKFSAHNIKLEFQEFNHPVYKQLYDPFIANLSIIDYLFNCGSKL